MKRRIGLLAVAALVSSLGMFVPAGPASADVCAGQGNANLSTGFGLPVVTSNTANFTFNFGLVGACVQGTVLTATGTVTGACGLSTGTGVTNTGDSFSFTSQGTALVLTGDVTGAVSALEDPTDAGSCTNKTATSFLITGAACNVETTVTVGTIVDVDNCIRL